MFRSLIGSSLLVVASACGESGTTSESVSAKGDRWLVSASFNGAPIGAVDIDECLVDESIQEWVVDGTDPPSGLTILIHGPKTTADDVGTCLKRQPHADVRVRSTSDQSLMSGDVPVTEVGDEPE
jgi:hypothetical protein